MVFTQVSITTYNLPNITRSHPHTDILKPLSENSNLNTPDQGWMQDYERGEYLSICLLSFMLRKSYLSPSVINLSIF